MSKIEHWYQTAYKHQTAGNLAAAEPLYRRILEKQPRHLEALYLLGSLCAQQSRYDEALPLLERALAIRPQFTEALNNRGVALAALGRWEQALDSYAAAVRLRPDYAEALNNQGIALQKAGRLEEAIDSFQKASTLRTDYAQALNNLGIAYKTVDRQEEAESAFRRAMTAQADYPEAVNNVGLTHLSRGQFDEALHLFDQAIALQHDFPQAHNNRAAALKELGRYEEALAGYTEAFALKPDYVEAYYNLGTCLVADGRLDEAQVYYDKALAIKPDDVNAHWNRALGLLVAGDYGEGWREYEWRFRCKAVKEHVSSRPRWDGSELVGRTILVHSEQGFGDTLNFLRYLPLVKACGGRVLFECQPALLSLLDGYPGIDVLLGPPEKGQDHTEPYDVQIPLLSLPGVFGTRPDTIPADTPRIQTPKHFAEAWQARLAEISSSIPGRLKVGLVWAGNPSHKNDHNRSCSLAALAPLAQIPGVVFYSLQKGPAAAQAASAPAGMTLIDLGPALSDFADTAAVIEQLDLVIAVDTSVVHLAGALGKPTWMLTAHGPDWRWFMDREDSPWYSCVRLFRQSRPRDWEPVIARVTSELHAFATQIAPSAEAQDLAGRGETYYASGDVVQAMRCFEDAIAQNPADARALNNVAVLAYGAGGYDAAIQVLTQALAAEPDHAGALENMARSWQAKGEYAQAVGWYQKALTAAPHNTTLWNSLGQVCLRLGEIQAAREVFEQSLTLDDTQQSVREALAALTTESDAEATAPVPAPRPVSPEVFLRSFRRGDLEAYCRSCYSTGEALAQTAYARRDSAAIHTGGVANADSRFIPAKQEWDKIAARLGELKSLEQAGHALVSCLPEWETQLRPALEVFCRTGAEYHLLAGYLKGRADIDARAQAKSSTQDSLVSIVVACYNYAHFLPETVASVLTQTYQNWELIIVNDGSTDNTAEVAAHLIAAHPDRRIRVINQQNKRLAGARNSGIRAAQGRYILPLDADDMIEPTMLAQCVAVLDARPNLSMAYPDQTHFNEQGEVWKAYSLDWDFAQELSYNLVCVCCLFRRSMWEEAGGYREDCVGAEDWDFWIQCGERGHQAWRIPQALFRYRKHGASLSVTDAPRHDYLKADIIQHHPHLYSPATVRWARGVAAGYEWLHPKAGWIPEPATALVSVIVPTYNRSQMLVHALESILGQTYQNFEIIVVNDAGEDVSHVIEPLNAEGRITLINKPANKGLADSRNVGIAAARGKYIAYLDDDDLYYTDHLEMLVTFLENTGFQVAYADALRAHQRKGPDGVYETWHRDQPYSRDFDYDVILTGNFSPVQCYMHEKACLDEVGFFDTTLSSHEDWDLWLRLSRRFDCVHLKKTTSEFTWRQDGSSMTSKQQRDYQRTTAMIYRKSRVFAQDNPRLLAHYDAFLRQWEQIENTPAATPAKHETAKPIMIALTARLVKERGLDPYKPCPCGSGKRLKFCHYGKEIDAKVLAQATQDWKTDIIVVVHNQLDYTRRCVESLYQNTKDFQLLLWDNGSDTPTRAYLEEIGRRENVTLCRSEENLGFIVPNNRLAAQGHARHLILLNSDTEVQSGWDSALCNYLDSHPETGAVGYEGGLLGPDALGCGQGHGDEIDYVAGWCLCLSRQTYETYGLFDEQNLQFAYGEDSDLSLRLQEAGLRLHVLCESRVTHFGNKTINAVSRQRDTRPTFQANHAYLRRHWADYLKEGRVLARQERIRREVWEQQIVEAEAIYALGDVAGAVERFQALAAQEPADIRVLNNLGVILWQQGKVTDGLGYFVRALQTDMDDRTTVLNCAEALQTLGQAEDARQLLDVFLQKHPEDVEATTLRDRWRDAAAGERIAA